MIFYFTAIHSSVFGRVRELVGEIKNGYQSSKASLIPKIFSETECRKVRYETEQIIDESLQLATNFDAVDDKSSGNASHKPSNQPGISGQWKIQGVQSVQMDPFKKKSF